MAGGNMDLLSIVLETHSLGRWVIVAGVAHMSIRWRKADAPIRARNYLALIVGVLLIVLVGISLLPQGRLA